MKEFFEFLAPLGGVALLIFLGFCFGIVSADKVVKKDAVKAGVAE